MAADKPRPLLQNSLPSPPKIGHHLCTFPYVKSVAAFALTFFGYIISVLASVGRVGFCSTTAAIKILFILVSLLLLVLFLQNMFYAVYAKFNLHEIRLVHQQSSWNEKPAKMVELHQMTSNLNESQRLRRITLQLSFAHYIFLLYLRITWFY